MLKLIVFVVVSLGITALSWRSLADTRSHGFYRFFGFESLLILILRNADWWFADPIASRQLVSWILLLTSAYFAADGFYLLHSAGAPRKDIGPASLHGIERTSRLVTRGIFKLIRHPLYASLLMVGWATFLKNPSLPALALAIIESVFLFLTAKIEEKENAGRFGDEYAAYRSSTKMFIPYLL